MAKSKSNPGNEFNETELGGELPENSAHSFTEGSETGSYELEKPSTQSRPKGKYLASGGDIHEFKEKGDVFVGKLTDRKLIREKDGKEKDQKAGDVMGYYFEDPSGRPSVIGNSHQIQKSVEAVKPGAVLWIEFLGSKDLGGGRSVNQFDIIEVDPSEYGRFGF